MHLARNIAASDDGRQPPPAPDGGDRTRERAMRPLDVLRQVWSAGATLSTTERAVLTALILRSDDGGQSWPSLSRIAADTGLGRSGVAKTLAALERGGWVERVRRPRPATTMYVVRPPDSPPGGLVHQVDSPPR